METRQQAEQAAVAWIARRETGPWSAADAADFDTWIEGSMTRRVAYYRFRQTWDETGRLSAFGGGNLPAHPLAEAAGEAVTSGSPARVRWKRVAIAACLVLSIASVLYLFRDPLFGLNVHRTAVGGLATVPLPDGSRLTLNTHTQLRVSVDRDRRHVDVKHGEVFFDVAKDATRPFTVSSGGKRITVVGTQFAVRSEGEDDIRVSVLAGAVRFAAPESRGVLLTAGAVARVSSAGIVVEHRSVADVERSLSWRTGLLTFRDTPLMQAVAEFNRYNTRQLFIDDPGIAAIEVGGVFKATDLDAFLKLMKEGLEVRASRQGNRIVLTAR